MSLQPAPWPEPDEQVSQAIRAMYARRRAPLAVVIRDELGEVFADAEFAEAFAVRGQPGWSPGRLTMITVLQSVENLTDRQAAEAVRLRLDWKYLLGLGLTEDGLDDSVLSEFRTRVVQHGLEGRCLDVLVAALVERGLLKAGGKQRTDSTHVIAAVRVLNQIELVGESVRAGLEALTVADPGWVTTRLDSSWARRYTARVDSWRMPSSAARRAALGVEYARDGHALLAALADPASPPWLREVPAVEILRRVLIQNVIVTVDRGGREVIRLREADTDGLPPGKSRIVSPYDTDARWGGKRDLTWHGYKIHVSESCDGDPPTTTVEREAALDIPPNLITNVATTDASVPDTVMTEPIHADLHRRGIAPGEHYLDSGYPSADLLVSSLTDYGVRLITPMLADSSPQARAGQGYDRTAFSVDWDTTTVTCPQGNTNASWTPATQRGTDVIVVKFPGEACHACPVKAHCTSAARGGRQLTLRPRTGPGSPRRGQSRADHHRLADPLRPPGRRPVHDRPGRQGQQRPTSPLPGTRQDPPAPHHHGRRTQPHPPRRLVQRRDPRPPSNHPPVASGIRPRRLTRIRQQGRPDPETGVRRAIAVDRKTIRGLRRRRHAGPARPGSL